MVRRVLWTGVLLFAVPVFGFIITGDVLQQFRTEFAAAAATSASPAALSILSGAPCPSLSVNQFLSRPCISAGQVQILRLASIGIAAVTVLMLAAIWGAAAYAGGSRDRLISLFRPGLVCVIALLFCIIIGQAGILTFSTFVIGFASTGELSLNAMRFALPAAAGGVAAAYGMVVAAMTALKPEPTSELALELTREAQPRLWSFVEDIARKLNAKPPRQIICGLDTSFFATAWDLKLRGRAKLLQGETMYVSLPLMRVLTPAELTCVVGHELGHFKGEDTVYSVRFVPIFAGTVSALESLEGDNVRLLGLPAIAVLNVFLESFALAQASVSRQRELEADRAGVSAGSADALASSLVKVVALSPLWQGVINAMMESMQRNESIRNASAVFLAFARQFVSEVDRAQLLSEIATARTAHPTDTHPALAERLAAVGLDLKQAEKWLDPGSECAIDLVENAQTLEEELTKQFEHMVDHYRRLPDRLRG